MATGGIAKAFGFVAKELGALLGNAFVAAMKEVFSSPTVLLGTVAAIGLLFAASAVKQVMVDKLADAMSGKNKPEIEGPSKPGGRGLMGRVGGLLKSGGLVGIGGMAADYAGGKLAEAGHTRSGAALDIAGSTAKYAGLGGMVGSVVPGLGTVIGAGIGGTIGLGAGLYNSGKKLLFGGDKKAETPPTGDMATAAQVATTTTPAQVRELSAALKELDYNKLILPDNAQNSLEAGTLKMRQLRGEVNAMSKAFKELNNTGLDKITAGLGRLDESFKSFNKSFVEDFMTKFKELDKKSQETLLTDLNDKMEMLNTTVKSLLELEEENNRHHKNTSRNTRATSSRVN